MKKQLVELQNQQVKTKNLNRQSDNHKKNYGIEAKQMQAAIEQKKREISQPKKMILQLEKREKNKQKELNKHIQKLHSQSIQTQPSATEKSLADNQKKLDYWHNRRSLRQKQLKQIKNSEIQVELNNAVSGRNKTEQNLTTEEKKITQQERAIKNLQQQIKTEKAKEQKEKENKPVTEIEKSLQKNIREQSAIKARQDKLQNTERALKSSQWKKEKTIYSHKEKLREKWEKLQAQYEHISRETGITHDQVLRQQAEQNPQAQALRNKIIQIEKDLYNLQAASELPSCSGSIPDNEKIVHYQKSINQLKEDGIDSRLELAKNKKMAHQLTNGTKTRESENIQRLQARQKEMRMQHKMVEVKQQHNHELDELQEKADKQHHTKPPTLEDKVTPLVWSAIKTTVAGGHADMSELKAVIEASDDPQTKEIVSKVMDKAVSKLVTDSQLRGNAGNVTDWREQKAVGIVHEIKENTGLESTAPVVQGNYTKPDYRQKMEKRSKQDIGERAEQFFKEASSSSAANIVTPRTTGAFVHHNKKYEVEAKEVREKEEVREFEQKVEEERKQSEKDSASIKKDNQQLISDVKSQRDDPEEQSRVEKHKAQKQKEMQEQKQAEEIKRSRETEERLKKLQAISHQWHAVETPEPVSQTVQKIEVATTVIPVLVPPVVETEKPESNKVAQHITSDEEKVTEKTKPKEKVSLPDREETEAGSGRNLVTVSAHTGGSYGGGSSQGGSGSAGGSSQRDETERTVKRAGNIAGFAAATGSEKDDSTKRGSNIQRRGNMAGFVHNYESEPASRGSQSGDGELDRTSKGSDNNTTQKISNNIHGFRPGSTCEEELISAGRESEPPVNEGLSAKQGNSSDTPDQRGESLQATTPSTRSIENTGSGTDRLESEHQNTNPVSTSTQLTTDMESLPGTAIGVMGNDRWGAGKPSGWSESASEKDKHSLALIREFTDKKEKEEGKQKNQNQSQSTEKELVEGGYGSARNSPREKTEQRGITDQKGAEAVDRDQEYKDKTDGFSPGHSRDDAAAGSSGNSMAHDRVEDHTHRGGTETLERLPAAEKALERVTNGVSSDIPREAEKIQQQSNDEQKLKALGPGKHLDKTVLSKEQSESRLAKDSAYKKLESQWQKERKSADEIKREASELKNINAHKQEMSDQKQQKHLDKKAEDKLYLKTEPGQHLDKTVLSKEQSESRLAKDSAYKKLESQWEQERKSADEIKREASELKNINARKQEMSDQKQQNPSESAKDKLYLKTGPGQYLDKEQVGCPDNNSQSTEPLNRLLKSNPENKSVLYDKSLLDIHRKQWEECHEPSKTTMEKAGEIEKELEAQKRRAEEIALKGEQHKPDSDKAMVEK